MLFPVTAATPLGPRAVLGLFESLCCVWIPRSPVPLPLPPRIAGHRASTESILDRAACHTRPPTWNAHHPQRTCGGHVVFVANHTAVLGCIMPCNALRVLDLKRASGSAEVAASYDFVLPANSTSPFRLPRTMRHCSCTVFLCDTFRFCALLCSVMSLLSCSAMHLVSSVRFRSASCSSSFATTSNSAPNCCKRSSPNPLHRHFLTATSPPHPSTPSSPPHRRPLTAP